MNSPKGMYAEWRRGQVHPFVQAAVAPFGE